MSDIHIYGNMPDQEVLTAWMVASDLPSVATGDTIIGNVLPDRVQTLLPTITGAACTAELPALAHLPHRLVTDVDCRKLHSQTYAPMPPTYTAEQLAQMTTAWQQARSMRYAAFRASLSAAQLDLWTAYQEAERELVRVRRWQERNRRPRGTAHNRKPPIWPAEETHL